jgi:hypothetical protein
VHWFGYHTDEKYNAVVAVTAFELTHFIGLNSVLPVFMACIGCSFRQDYSTRSRCFALASYIVLLVVTRTKMLERTVSLYFTNAFEEFRRNIVLLQK